MRDWRGLEEVKGDGEVGRGEGHGWQVPVELGEWGGQTEDEYLKYK